jgi:hypothetical protein
VRKSAFLLAGTAIVAGIITLGSRHSDAQSAPIFVTTVPQGYRDWRLIKVFGQSQSFVPGAATNIQFMVKDSTKYAATGGWALAFFRDGKPADEASMKTCFPCHDKVKARDLVFTRYAP